ncbi:response regulator [Leptospira gomenensis]|uniref:Response regulator n=1 Tax=Leptospira gomenensis TaxID=2484974 RepID=A0A5F1Y866_9LEPT|nr:response regulator [Leptospira gomenensis]TGK30880.1 response regulator [Leptospira gomenensis]TGK32518.1 response regulator [Leptospira gomenensis]TGK45400.1 response regulator [Leptospira gomenensis]TGK60608.1 response regulator [Leptospira gomenensis]
MYTILIVEDIHSIREAIKDLLTGSYRVLDAENYDEAVRVLKNEDVHLVITDIRMPGKTGLDLIKTIQHEFPNVLYTLMTAYNINDYINFAYKHGIWNIIPKYSFLDIKLISVMVRKLLTKDIFGVEKYFGPEFTIQKSDTDDREFSVPQAEGIVYKRIYSDEQRNFLCNRISKFLVEKGAPNAINQILEELTSNAMIRAPRDSKGNYKYQYELPSRDLVIPLENIQLAESDFFEIGYGIAENTFIIVIRDHFGSLDKKEILKRLDRHITVDEATGFPPGLADSHGRGLYICREISDQLIFNIEREKRTEIIALLDKQGNKSYKSLSIYEV